MNNKILFDLFSKYIAKLLKPSPFCISSDDVDKFKEILTSEVDLVLLAYLSIHSFRKISNTPDRDFSYFTKLYDLQQTFLKLVEKYSSDSVQFNLPDILSLSDARKQKIEITRLLKRYSESLAHVNMEYFHDDLDAKNLIIKYFYLKCLLETRSILYILNMEKSKLSENRFTRTADFLRRKNVPTVSVFQLSEELKKNKNCTSFKEFNINDDENSESANNSEENEKQTKLQRLQEDIDERMKNFKGNTYKR